MVAEMAGAQYEMEYVHPRVIRAAYELIKDKSRWTKDHAAVDADGKATVPDDPDNGFVFAPGRQPVKWCALGALARFGTNEDTVTYISSVAAEMFPNAGNQKYTPGLVTTNDLLGHEAVVQVFEKAITNLEGGL